MDDAFCFYYRSNIESIQERACVVYFSPIRDALPDVAGLYFGGGYPGLHATQLSANRHLLEDIRTNADEGMPIYGECGGLMYFVAIAVYRRAQESFIDQYSACGHLNDPEKASTQTRGSASHPRLCDGTQRRYVARPRISLLDRNRRSRRAIHVSCNER